MKEKIKNLNRLKNKGYIIGITAVIIAAVILLNLLISSFSPKLKFDFSSQKLSSFSEENKEYIKNLKEKVSITVCANEQTYADSSSYGMLYYAYNYYGAAGNGDNDYYAQTLSLINKYGDYSKNIEIKFIDTQSAEFAGVMNSYPNESLKYGDIIVASPQRYRVVRYSDIYKLEAGGSGYYTVVGNNIETALTSAVDYVISGKDIKVAILTGHSKTDYTDDYAELLKKNNYTVDIIDNKMITAIDDNYSAVIIAAPTSDFLENELTALSNFLENTGKGLIYFADATAPFLPDFSAFLEKWGIEQSEGILFETAEQYHIEGEPTTIGFYPSGEDDITSNMNYCISGYNVPLLASDTVSEDIKVTTLFKTSPNAVAAPAADWQATNGDYITAEYSGVIMSQKSINNADSSFVIAFSSVEYIKSQWVQYAALSNQNISISAAEKASGAQNKGITFTTKTIENESYYDKVTETSASFMNWFFVRLLPLAVIAVGIYVFFKRRNK
ncbi:MAG: GldG family protein [Clostridia bacterium]|nr:GldG family protein [Clostridia bacterium]